MFSYTSPACSELASSSTQSKAALLTFLTKYPSLIRIGSRSMSQAIPFSGLSELAVKFFWQQSLWAGIFTVQLCHFHKFLCLLIT